jgi:apolipoprotein N-acyltransferase
MRGLLLALGCAQALSMAWPWAGEWYGSACGLLQWVSLAALAWWLDRVKSPAQAFEAGWWFALGWLSASTWWLWISMHVYGQMPSVLAALAVLLLNAALALFYGVASWGYHQVRTEMTGPVMRASLFAACWFLAEWARGTWFTGFPWAAGGYAHVDSWLRYWAPWVGVYGLGIVSAWAGMLVVCRRTDRVVHYPKYQLALAMILAIVAAVAGWSSALERVLVQERSGLRVTLIQGNVPQETKFAAGAQQALGDYRQDLQRSQADLTVLPETAVPVFAHQLPIGYWSGLVQDYARGDRAALVGMPTLREGQSGFANSVVALLPKGRSYQYDKYHLVPFGEFVPPTFQWFMDLMKIPLGSFSRGDIAQPSLGWMGERLAPMICYEDLFGEELARRFGDPESAPTILVNVSNLAWFGDTVALEQHLNIARMRSMEFHRPTIRATNTGVTAYIDAQGVVQARLPNGVRDRLQVKVAGIDGESTAYALWAGRWGLWPLVGLALAVLVAGSTKSYRQRHGRRRFGT